MRMMMRSVESGIHEAVLARPLPLPESQSQVKGPVLDIDDPPRQHYPSALQAFATASVGTQVQINTSTCSRWADRGSLTSSRLHQSKSSSHGPWFLLSCCRRQWLRWVRSKGGKGINETSFLKYERATKWRPVIWRKIRRFSGRKQHLGPQASSGMSSRLVHIYKNVWVGPWPLHTYWLGSPGVGKSKKSSSVTK